jgi:hypothetical protein
MSLIIEGSFWTVYFIIIQCYLILFIVKRSNISFISNSAWIMFFSILLLISYTRVQMELITKIIYKIHIFNIYYV